MNKKSIQITAAVSFGLVFLAISFIHAQTQTLSGRILLQVQSHGEAWYISPTNNLRYYLGTPADAFELIRRLGVGIKNQDLAKIPVGLSENLGTDTDQDGLNNDLELALGTDPNQADSDHDGFSDAVELKNNYNPLNNTKLNLDSKFTEKNLGRIFLQVENKGQAWYINPVDQKRYFLNRPTDAFNLMKNQGLGISNLDLEKISIGSLLPIIPPIYPPVVPTSTPPLPSNETDKIMAIVADGIRASNNQVVLSYFTNDLKGQMEYTMNFYKDKPDNRLSLGNLFSSASLTSSTETTKIYSAKAYFALGGKDSIVNFTLTKQADGHWLISGLLK